MIDIKSLRLDNWILYKDEPVQVYHIDRGGTTHFRLNDLPVNKDTGCTLGTANLDFKPIPLSGEVLEACGFKKHENSNEYWTHWRLPNGWHISESHHDEPSAGVETGFFYWGDDYTEFKTLHLLQNFYFAHTKTELTYNPSK